MKAGDVRDTIVQMLHEYTQVEVYRSGQVSPEPKIPYIIYSVTSPYQPEATPGHFETVAGHFPAGEAGRLGAALPAG